MSRSRDTWQVSRDIVICGVFRHPAEMVARSRGKAEPAGGAEVDRLRVARLGDRDAGGVWLQIVSVGRG